MSKFGSLEKITSRTVWGFIPSPLQGPVADPLIVPEVTYYFI